MHNQCSVCGASGVSLCMIDDQTLNICKECGGIFWQDRNMIIQMPMPLKQDNNIVAVATAMSTLYKVLGLQQE